METTTAQPERRVASPNLIMVTLSLCGVLVSLQQTLLLPLLPDLPEILHTTADNAPWMITVTLLSGAVATPVISRLADAYGKRRMIVVTLLLMILGSLIGSFSTTLAPALVARALLGTSIAMLPVGIAIMRDELPPDRVPLGVSLLSATLSFGAGLGVPLGGALGRYADWHATFWLPGALAVALVILLPRVVPESSVVSRGRFDIAGSILLSLGLVALLLAISKGGTWGWFSAQTATFGVVGVVILAAVWVPHQLRVAHPLVDLRTAARPAVTLVNAAGLGLGFAVMINMLVTSQLLQTPTSIGGLGQSPMAAGMWMIPGTVAFAVFAPISAWLSARFCPQTTMLIGTGATAVGFVASVFLSSQLWQIALVFALTSAAISIAYAVMPTILLRSVPATESASVNGLNTLMRSVGTSVASAAVAAVIAASAIQVGDRVYPTHSMMMVLFWASVVTLVATILVAPLFRIPGLDQATAEAVGIPERVLRGVVREPDGTPLGHAMVTVMGPHGVHVDWDRADASGTYTIAVPDEGRHLLVVSADGWDPESTLIDLHPELESQDLVVRERTAVLGRLTLNGAPVSHGSVVITRRSGEYVSAARVAPDGTYRIDLREYGRFVASGIDLQGSHTRAVPFASGATSVTVDIDLTPAAAPTPTP
uniref:MFS transporter n=1 Tax=Kribbia dieselivorans TaxID=331526 RepID=UPI00083868F8